MSMETDWDAQDERIRAAERERIADAIEAWIADPYDGVHLNRVLDIERLRDVTYRDEIEGAVLLIRAADGRVDSRIEALIGHILDQNAGSNVAIEIRKALSHEVAHE